MKGLKSLHGFGDFPDEPVILLHDVVEVLNLPYFDLKERTTQNEEHCQMQVNGIKRQDLTPNLALDLIRLGGKRENKIAKEILENYIWNQ